MDENNTFTRVFLKFASFLMLGLLLMACEPPQENRNLSSNSTAPNSNANSGTNSQAATTTTRGSNLPITMPVIDAMFSDEDFAAEARTSVDLTDEEIAKVKNSARDAVLQLNGDPAEDDTRSTKNTTESTSRELESLIGKEKANALIAFVQDRWAGDLKNQPLAAPNSVPTDSRIVVNAPAYRMDVFHDGKLTKTYKVGIGYPEFPLPTGLREAKEIIFNPTWTPPDEPWVKGKFQPGKKVEAGSKLNPLGPIKIPIGLPSLIHGGKDPARLGTFASHGCVGLTNSMIQDFAMELASLSGTPLTADEIKQHAKAKDETKDLKLSAPVPVELRYETIVVEDGKVHIYRDVYELGTNTEENLRKVLSTFGVSFDQLSESDKTQLGNALGRMAVDAKGKTVTDKPDNSDKKSGRITRNVKGEKEIIVEIAALKGKGYPAPAALVQR